MLTQSIGYGIGFVLALVIGGAFTSRVTWRWCFYLNLPIGAITLVAISLFFHPVKESIQEQTTAKESFIQKLRDLDLLGIMLLIGAATMLLLVLQWGGITVSWSSAEAIGLLVSFGVDFALFCAWQVVCGEKALVPPQILNSVVIASVSASFLLAGATMVYLYYLPYWFQAVRLASPIESGVELISFVAANFVFSIAAGVFVTKTGLLNLPALAGLAIATVGAGLLTTLTPNSRTWPGFEILTGAGGGMALQQYFMAVQGSLPPHLSSIGTTSILFAQGLAGAIFVSAGNNILRNELVTGLQRANLPSLDVNRILAKGVTSALIPPADIEEFQSICNTAMQQVFIMVVPLIAWHSCVLH